MLFLLNDSERIYTLNGPFWLHTNNFIFLKVFSSKLKALTFSFILKLQIGTESEKTYFFSIQSCRSFSYTNEELQWAIRIFQLMASMSLCMCHHAQAMPFVKT